MTIKITPKQPKTITIKITPKVPSVEAYNLAWDALMIARDEAALTHALAH